MNHGIAASEVGNSPGGTVWDWAMASGEGLVVFTRTRSERAVHPDGKARSKAGVRVIGGINVWPSKYMKDHRVAYEDFGRYEPLEKPDFVLMCSYSLGGYPPSSTLVAPTTITDEIARALLEEFHQLAPRLEHKVINNQRVARIVKRRPIGIRWAYLLAFNSKIPTTIFVSEDPGIVDEFENHSLKYPDDYKIQERW